MRILASAVAGILAYCLALLASIFWCYLNHPYLQEQKLAWHHEVYLHPWRFGWVHAVTCFAGLGAAIIAAPRDSRKILLFIYSGIFLLLLPVVGVLTAWLGSGTPFSLYAAAWAWRAAGVAAAWAITLFLLRGAGQPTHAANTPNARDRAGLNCPCPAQQPDGTSMVTDEWTADRRCILPLDIPPSPAPLPLPARSDYQSKSEQSRSTDALTQHMRSDIRFKCPSCEQSLEAPADMGGESIACPGCCESINIPPSPPQETHESKSHLIYTPSADAVLRTKTGHATVFARIKGSGEYNRILSFILVMPHVLLVALATIAVGGAVGVGLFLLGLTNIATVLFAFGVPGYILSRWHTLAMRRFKGMQDGEHDKPAEPKGPGYGSQGRRT